MTLPVDEALLEAVPADLRAEARRVLAASEFVADALRRDPGLAPELFAPEPFDPRSDAPLELLDEPSLMHVLRLWRRREMARIAARDIAGVANLATTLADLSGFADRAIRLACEAARRAVVARWGTPRLPDGTEMPMIVVGMGKLGGQELNFSSDVDLVFLYPAAGETDGPQPASHDEFFLRLGQTLIRLLAAPTVDGFVFRVDMRLRPFGDSGALACSFAAFEDYLGQHGRDWERYAWVKARAIVGEDAYAELYANVVRPFVYRRYLDFGVFEALREMKGLIEKQVARRDMAEHVKLGPGGIREIEFVVQALQLIRGGQDRRLQNARLMEVLPMLAGARLLPSTTVESLLAAYRFLRDLENRLQMLRDQQTHQLPNDEPTRARLALAMRRSDWSSLYAELQSHREVVRRAFEALVFRPASENGEAVPEPPAASRRGAASNGEPAGLALLWDETLDATALAEVLAAAGVAEPRTAAQLLVDFRSSGPVRRLDQTSLRRLQVLLGSLLADLRGDEDGLVLLRRFLRVLEAIGARSAYFALLNETPAARRRFVSVCRGGEFLVTQIAAHPLLLDELLDERVLAELPSRAELAAEVVERVARVDPDDPERLVEALVQFKRAAVFRVAVADLAGRLPLMKVSDRLTEIAELIIGEAMRMAWRQMTQSFGTPLCGTGAARREVRVCAVGYGKLGGYELGYASDLDLVFLHDSAGEQQETSGERPLDNQVFFVRLAQRIMHILSVHSAAGRLYEVDVRLRPSGKGGLLMTHIGAFAEYQRTEAWTWEHQAMLHSRAVAGDAALCAEYERLRMELLVGAVRRDGLRKEVREMRLRMRRELSKSKAGEFDVKQDPGGISDIEFLAQYWALRWAADYPPVAMFPDTIRQLESVASAALVPQEDVDRLTAAYRAYRERGHHRSLREESNVVPSSEFLAERQAVSDIWARTMDV